MYALHDVGLISPFCFLPSSAICFSYKSLSLTNSVKLLVDSTSSLGASTHLITVSFIMHPLSCESILTSHWQACMRHSCAKSVVTVHNRWPFCSIPDYPCVLATDKWEEKLARITWFRSFLAGTAFIRNLYSDQFIITNHKIKLRKW